MALGKRGDPPQPPDRPGRPPEAELREAILGPEKVELRVAVRNPNDRALYVISEVRVILYDPAARRLRVQLSDTGRTLRPGIASKIPRMRTIDPMSQAELRLELPPTITRLAPTPPGAELAMEELAIHEAADLELVIGWAATPYYRDPRPGRGHDAPELTAWQDDEVTLNAPLRGPQPLR